MCLLCILSAYKAPGTKLALQKLGEGGEEREGGKKQLRYVDFKVTSLIHFKVLMSVLKFREFFNHTFVDISFSKQDLIEWKCSMGFVCFFSRLYCISESTPLMKSSSGR